MTRLTKLIFSITPLFFFFSLCCFSLPPASEGKIKTLYNSLEPASISQHLAFYELYKHHYFGQKALNDAWNLLTKNRQNLKIFDQKLSLSRLTIETILSLINKSSDQEFSFSDQEAFETMKQLSSQLHHYPLKGHHVWNEKDVLALPLDQIDVARGLFISQFGDDRQKIHSYEGLIDLMALQIMARLSDSPTPEEKIQVINTFIFEEMGFRFPPRSLYAKDIDLYSYLPSVLDSRRGVCLGVSILYLCIAQRLNLPLEMITPPGHIFVRYRENGKLINIETTARGVHMDSEEYLNVNTCALQMRTIKEVIGMVHFNQASIYWQNQDYENVLKSYQRAEAYMSDDPLLKELMGFVLLLTDQQEKGEELLRSIQNDVPIYEISKNTMIDDYFSGNIDAKGIAVLFSKSEEDRKSILAKKKELEDILIAFPQFRSGLMQVAGCWIQLHRLGEALEVLERLHKIDPNDPEVLYYLSILFGMRHDYIQSWSYLKKAENLTRTHNYSPKVLKELRRELLRCSPEY